MPTYDYLCQSCGHGFEQFQSITAKRLRKCPKCKKLKLNRLIGAGAGIIFKGSGFYETDYRSESYKKGKEAEKPKADTKKDELTDPIPKYQSIHFTARYRISFASSLNFGCFAVLSSSKTVISVELRYTPSADSLFNAICLFSAERDDTASATRFTS